MLVLIHYGRASLDTIDFMPLASANYSGGIIITDWYSSENSNESIKVSIRFLSNEVRSDALDIKVFYKKCSLNENCTISEKSGKLVNELNKKILQKAVFIKNNLKIKILNLTKVNNFLTNNQSSK